MSLIQRPISRRQLLRLGTASFLAAFLHPRRLLAAPEVSTARGFQFLVVNDTHYTEAECGLWLQKAVAQMKTHRADFCVLNGDLSENGRSDQLGGVCEVFSKLGIPVYKLLGNHDYVSNQDCRNFLEICGPDRNYAFSHKGWQFVALDSTQGTHVFRTQIQPHTFYWLDTHLPHLDKSRPTVLFTHFPLGRNITRPTNSDELLLRFAPFQMRAVFNGHWHGLSESDWRGTPVMTDRCCSRLRENRDGSKEKGYFLCRAEAGKVTRRFIPVAVG